MSRRTLYRILLPIQMLLILVCFVTSSSAETLSPGAKVKDVVLRVKAIMNDKVQSSQSEIDEKILAIINPSFDFRAMSQSCLAANWKKADKAEQDEFVDLFSSLLRKTYLSRIRDNIAESKVDIVDERIRGDKAVVKTKVEDKGDLVAIDYRMKLSGDAWRVHDVSIENVWLVSNYRSEFSSILRKSKMQGLLESLREKNRKLEEKK
ncbi:MAG: ABC transporter substrate-binding protein [bacterium]|nr:ABC transporter substrate-binding protein [bacterium]